MALARRRVLPQVARFDPLETVDGDIEVHMLLNHPRVFVGLWAIYSFFSLAGATGRIVIHDDGTLTTSDFSLIEHLFPRARVISRPEADSLVLPRLASEEPPRCLELRSKLALALKLLDIPVVSNTDQVILLDSDVIFFRPAAELFRSAPSTLFLQDVKSQYCASDAALTSIVGISPVPRLNSGLLRVPVDALSLQICREMFSHP